MADRDADQRSSDARAARDALTRLADDGERRVVPTDRPIPPPPAPRGKVALAFPVAEDRDSPVNERPGMAAPLQIHVASPALTRDDAALIRRALRSFHPAFELAARTVEDDARPAPLGSPSHPNPGGFVIELPSRPLAQPTTWIRRVIEDLLPLVHRLYPIRTVRYGRASTGVRTI